MPRPPGRVYSNQSPLTLQIQFFSIHGARVNNRLLMHSAAERVANCSLPPTQSRDPVNGADRALLRDIPRVFARDFPVSSASLMRTRRKISTTIHSGETLASHDSF